MYTMDTVVLAIVVLYKFLQINHSQHIYIVAYATKVAIKGSDTDIDNKNHFYFFKYQSFHVCSHSTVHNNNIPVIVLGLEFNAQVVTFLTLLIKYEHRLITTKQNQVTYFKRDNR